MSKGFEPQTFTAKFLYKGVAVYKEENVLINTYIEDIANTFIGANVTIGHVYDELKKGDLRIVGTVVRVFCNKEGFTTKDGKFIEADCDYYADFILHNEAAINSWKMMGFVSCAYTVLEAEGGGTYINGPYNSEIKRVRADEFAIVSQPRYEDSKIIKNSNETEIEIMTTENKEVKSEATAFTALHKALEIIGSKFSNSKKSKANDQAYDEDKEMDEMENKKNDKGREIDGEMVMYNDLENCWKNSKAAKKNAEDKEEEEKKNAMKKNDDKEEEDKESKKNAEDEEGDIENSKKNDDKEEEDKEKENSKKKNSSTSIGDARNSFAHESKSVGYISPSALAREMFDK